MKNFVKYLISCLGGAIAGVLVGAFLNGLTGSGSDGFNLAASDFFSGFALMLGGVGLAIAILICVKGALKKMDDSGGSSVKTDKDKFYDQHWCTEKELHDTPRYMFTTYDKLKYSKKVGFPLRVEKKNGKLIVNMYDKDLHCLVIGTTGAGKTTQFVNPLIQIFSESAAKPSIVITDPKGELYNLHSEKLRKQGYRVMVFNLDEPFKSTRWNPMERAYNLWEKARTAKQRVGVHNMGDQPSSYPTLAYSKDVTYTSPWYEYEGNAYATKEDLERALTASQQQYRVLAEAELKEICEALCIVESKNDPRWEMGAKNFVNAVMLAMLEDSDNPDLGMTRDKFNFFNVAQIANYRDNDPNNDMLSITDYFNGRPVTCHSVNLSSEVIKNSDKTKQNYLSISSGYLEPFTDAGICYCTSANEMDLSHFDDQSTALFIKIPDEKVGRHKIATLFISQLYKTLTEIARENGRIANDDQKAYLKHPTYFILDEFANMPPIDRFDNKITVARSRHIFFCLILQSYTQLNTKYGNEVAAIVRDNCNMHVYIASNDDETKKAFSERCGNTTVTTTTKSSSSSGEGDKKSKSSSTQVSKEQRPLIYPDELGSLKEDLIVSILKEPPIKAPFQPSYKLSEFFDMRRPEPDRTLAGFFDETQVLYDIRNRNQVVLPQRKSGFGGFGGFGGF